MHDNDIILLQIINTNSIKNNKLNPGGDLVRFVCNCLDDL